jgi:murein L,D-transpeptidase YafK
MKISPKIAVIFVVATALFIALLIFGRSLYYPIYLKIIGRKTTEQVYETTGQKIEAKLKPRFEKAVISYPSEKITLIAVKDRQTLEIWATETNKSSLIHTYKFTGFSGTLGPKLKEGDGQIPEGLYKIDYLNPNSRFHLSMKLSYPNEFDKANGKLDGRENLGGDIMIHGSNATIGCIPIGDSNIEELFTLVYKTGIKNVDVIIAPNDLRVEKPNYHNSSLKWLDAKYQRIHKALAQFK